MMSNMSASLIEHEMIKTTVVKAKELRRYVEPLITLSKVDSVANRRLAFARLRSKAAVGKLFSELGPRYHTRPGGYTRILKAGFRRGDSAMLAYMQLVDQPDTSELQRPEPPLPAAERVEPATVAEAAQIEAAASESLATAESEAVATEVASDAVQDADETKSDPDQGKPAT